MTDLNITAKSTKILEENTGENNCDFGLGKHFLDMTLMQDPQKKKLITGFHKS